ncbi:hypothetical protein [Crocinitomix algicola]|uniref:hypothetical protein n=1 Tax=Crocinitomix algicola TaxID=1740263 RepID=UPI0009F6A75C|nr:hypothetical protein [Crocinitomix algicola]
MMDIKKQLLIENSKANWQCVSVYVGSDPRRFSELMDCFFSKDVRIVQRSSQPVGAIGAKHPHLLLPYLQPLLDYLNQNPIDAVQRNVMRALQYLDIPEEFEGPYFDQALVYLKSPHSAIAVKAFAMTVLANICEKYPELSHEVIAQLEILIREEVSKGVTARGKKELKKLRKLVKLN